MKLRLKQRMFSWFDSYDIYDEQGNTAFVVKGKLAWGHLLKVYDPEGNELGYIKEKIFSWLTKFKIYIDGNYEGCISEKLTLIKPKFEMDYKGWTVEGNWLEWDYLVIDSQGKVIANIDKDIWHFTDTYSIEIYDPANALEVLMLVLAIDAERIQ